MKLFPMGLRLGAVTLLMTATTWNQQVYPPGKTVQLGVLPDRWRSGGPRCMDVPDWQIHEYNEDFYILRESGCTHFEKPFLYLIFGTDRALLMDTGAGETDVAQVVLKTIGKWQARKQHPSPVQLIVTHSHAHGDHTAGDKQFQVLPNVAFIAATQTDLEKAFHITPYPNGIGSVDLGSRTLDMIAIPGHEEASLAIYDRRTGILLTGDSFYPGRLSVRDWNAYAASAQRLVDFTEDKVVTHILGTHIEQLKMPYSDYVRGTLYQPDEHELALHRGDLLEWNDAIQKAKGVPVIIAKRSFTVIPREPQTPEQTEQTRRQYEQFEKLQQGAKWDQTKK